MAPNSVWLLIFLRWTVPMKRAIGVYLLTNRFGPFNKSITRHGRGRSGRVPRHIAAQQADPGGVVGRGAR